MYTFEKSTALQNRPYVRDEMERYFFLVEINLNTILVCLYNLDFHQFEGFGYRLEITLKKGKKKFGLVLSTCGLVS